MSSKGCTPSERGFQKLLVKMSKSRESEIIYNEKRSSMSRGINETLLHVWHPSNTPVLSCLAMSCLVLPCPILPDRYECFNRYQVSASPRLKRSRLIFLCLARSPPRCLIQRCRRRHELPSWRTKWARTSMRESARGDCLICLRKKTGTWYYRRNACVIKYLPPRHPLGFQASLILGRST